MSCHDGICLPVVPPDQSRQSNHAPLPTFESINQTTQRELVSKMLSAAYPDVLSSREVCKGFERLFEMIDDIQLDAPK